MTKKNAKKAAARARKEELGGHYQAHLRHVLASGAGEASAAEAMKYAHVHYGTPQGTVWLLSDDPVGAVLHVPVPAGPLTAEGEEQAFSTAVYPLINETSEDGGANWVQHLDADALRSWRLARRLVYGLLGTGSGRWNAVRIRARTGEELLRHPPKLMQELAAKIREVVPVARLRLQAPNDQLFVSLGARTFAMSTSMKRATTWPVYVTPIPPPSESSGSWECFSVEDVLDALRWPEGQPKARVVSPDQVRAGAIGEAAPPSMRRDVLVRRLGDDPPDAHYVYIRYDAARDETFEDAVAEARKEASERSDLLELGIRRMDRPGHPTVCAWKRRTTNDKWTFSLDHGASDLSARAVVLAEGAMAARIRGACAVAAAGPLDDSA